MLGHDAQENMKMSGTISLIGLDKAEVFAALYNGARAQGLGFLHYDPTPMTAEQAKSRYGNGFGYFDYVDGRVMKVDLSGDELDTRLYDRDNGAGAAAAIIAALQTTGDTNPEEVELIHKEGTRNAALLANEHLYDQTTMEETPGLFVARLGIDEFTDLLKPKLDDILKEDDDD